jgi:hypothetical protein
MGAETELINQAMLKQPSAGSSRDERRSVAAPFTEIAAASALALLHRYETRLSRMYQRALRNLLTLRAQRAVSQQLTDSPPPESEEFQTKLPPPIGAAKPLSSSIRPSADPEIEPKRPSGGVAAKNLPLLALRSSDSFASGATGVSLAWAAETAQYNG